jgi:negative regulator of flagellin synthesis FlgM
MNIDLNKIGGNTVNPSPGAKPAGEKTNVASPKDASQEDRVSLTNTGTEMSALGQQVADASGIDREKIEAVRDALKRGDYPFDPDKIASRMLDMEKLLA